MNFYDSSKVAQGLACSPVQESQRQRLEHEKKYLTDRIAVIDRALAIFTQYPEMEEITDLLRRL